MSALQEMAVRTEQMSRINCLFQCSPPVLIEDHAVATHLYRIAQEAVNNALKHGRASKVDITLAERAEGLELSVENNGRPLPATKPAHLPRLRQFRQRIMSLARRLSGSGRALPIRCLVA